MKHYSPPKADHLVHEAALLTKLRAELNGTDAAKSALARRLGVSVAQLSGILRGAWPVSDAVAGALGYRKVVRFEPMS